MNWYLIKTLPGREKRVKERIDIMRSRAGMEEINEITVPTRVETRNQGEKRRSVEVPAFPGYVMIQMELTEETWEAVRQVLDVRGFVGYDEDDRNVPIPAPMPDSEVEWYLDAADADDKILDIRPGDTVRIMDGPFEDVRGKVADDPRSDGRLTVEVMVFGRATPMDVHHSQVEKA